MELAYAFNRLLVFAARCLGLAIRIGSGRGFPKARLRSAAEAPRERNPLLVVPRIPFLDLLTLQLPGAEALQERLAAMLADPEMAELIASEPAAWRAAAPLARMFRLPPPPRPHAEAEAEEPEPVCQEAPAAGPAPRRPEAVCPPKPEARRHRWRPDPGTDPPPGVW